MRKMATSDTVNIASNKKIEDKNDNSRIEVPGRPKIPPNSTHQSSAPKSQIQKHTQVSLADSGYKHAHPIGSRKVTENIITYHEPIFQTLANSLYENQKSLNMGKRKADDIEKGEPSSSPDVKRKKTESPKIDTGFKVKKKCSIENIIERIRIEKTQSRGGGGGDRGGSAGSTGGDKGGTSSKFMDGSPGNVSTTQQSGVSQTLQSAAGQSNKDVGHVTVTNNNSAGAESDKSVQSSTGNDVALDLSMKTVKTQTSEQKCPQSDTHSQKPDKCEHNSINKSKQSGDLKENSVPESRGKSDSERCDISTNISEMVKLSKLKKSNKSKQLTDTIKSNIIKKSDGKVNKNKLNKVKEQIKQNKALKTLKKSSKQKLGKESAINNSKPMNNKKGKMDNSPKSDKKKDTVEKSSKSVTDKNKKSVKVLDEKKSKPIKPAPENKNNKLKKQKVPIAFRRVKREASLNAATLVNILYEKAVSPKLENKRSKSESDIALTPKKSSMVRHSFTDILGKGVVGQTKTTDSDHVFRTPKKEPKSPIKVKSSSPKLLKVSLHQMDKLDVDKPECKSPKKDPGSPRKQKRSISDEGFDEIVRTVLKQSAEFIKTKKKEIKDIQQKVKTKEDSFVKLKEKSSPSKPQNKIKEKKESVKTNNKETKTTVKSTHILSKSPEEIAERKKKANLARMRKAKEILKAKELQSARDVVEVSDDSDSESDTDTPAVESDNAESDSNIRVQKGELCRSARTHVHVEAKTVVENTSVSPQWCECCQSTYYPSQPQHGAKMWRIKQLVDTGTQKPPELIQSASHHFIAAHTSCAVRPYSSPTHVSVLDSGPYVSPLMSHSHMGCSACGCRHTGVLHTAQCQSCAILPCQRYSSTYSVPYPHGHGAFPHCGHGTCSFHSAGQPLIHQPQIPISPEPQILVRHTVPLHDTSLPVPLQLSPRHDTSHTLQLSHGDPGITTCQVPLQRTDPGIQQISHCCQLSQGEIILRTNSQSDHELIDVGRDDFIKKSIKKSSHPTKMLKDKIEPKVKKKSSTTEIKKEISSQKVKSNKKIDQDKLKDAKKEITVLVKKKDKVTKKHVDLKQKPKEQVIKKLTKKEGKDVNKKGNSGSKTVTKGGKKVQTEEKEEVEDKKQYSAHGWTWDGEGVTKKVTNIFDGQPVERKCFKAIQHEDGEIIHVKDCVLVCSGRKEKDIPYVAKVTNFWEDPVSKEMMMTLLWYYRPEHVEGGRRPENRDNEVFAAKHLDESLVACIDDRGFVLTYNEYCRFIGEVMRKRYNLPLRKKVVPDPEEPYPSNRIPPLDVDPENVFLCRHVYDFKLKRVLKNPS